MHSLPLFHRLEGQRVLVLGSGEAAAAKARLVRRAGGLVIDDMREAVDTGVRLAFVAYEDDASARAEAANLRCAGLLVNVVDRPDLCDFTTPSICDRDPVLVAVGTGGASAGLAKHVRLRIEALLPATLGKLADALATSREAIRERFPDAATRRRVLDAALTPGGPLDPADGEAHGRVTQWASTAGSGNADQVVAFTLSSDDPEELTLRQARLLGMADTVLHDPAIPEAILCRARADAVRHPLPADPPRQGLTVILQRG